jgi:AcrR family transcriptional regulator
MDYHSTSRHAWTEKTERKEKGIGMLTGAKRKKRGRGRPRHDPRAWTARERLIKIAVRIFAAKGYAASTVNGIVKKAGVTKPVLYYHFKSKEGLFRGILAAAATLLEGTIRDRREPVASAGSARNRIRDLYAAIFDLFVANLDLARFLDVVMYGPPDGSPKVDLELFHAALRDAVRELVRDGLENGEFRGESEDDLMWGLLGILRITTETTLHHPRRSPGRDGMLRLVDLLLAPRTSGAKGKGRR